MRGSHHSDHDHGRDADQPGDIPGSGWRDVLWRVKHRITHDNFPIIAAGTAFYALLAAFPALIALFSVYRLLFTRSEIAGQVKALHRALANGTPELVYAWIERGAESSRWHLMLGAGGGMLVALWGASLGLRAMIRALNLAYGEEEKRSFVHRTGVALLLTLGGVCIAVSLLAAVAGFPLLIGASSDAARVSATLWVRWPLVAMLFWISLSVLYRYGPSRATPRWSWVSWGALLATLLWLAGSSVLSWYAGHVAGMQLSYGSMGFVVLVLVWFLLTAHAVLIGASINAELERQTRKDTTVGPEKPMGQRGATAADTVGRASK